MALCVICGNETGCICKGHWKNVACSYDHYLEFLDKYEGVTGRVPYKLRACVENTVYDIKDYVIKGNDINLVTTMPDKTLSLLETDYLIVLNGEKQYLLKSYNDDGQYIKIDKLDYFSKIKFNEPISGIAENNEGVVEFEDNLKSTESAEDDVENIDKRKKRKS